MAIKRNTELLIKNIERVKLIKEKLEKDLLENYNDELLNKIVEINKVLKNAEFLVNCTAEEAIDKFKEKFPSQVDKNGVLTKKGIKQLKLLNKRLGPFK